MCICLDPASGHVLKRNFISMVKDADIVPDMTWCKFVTNYIAESVKMYMQLTAASINIYGCVHVLLIRSLSNMLSAMQLLPPFLNISLF